MAQLASCTGAPVPVLAALVLIHSARCIWRTEDGHILDPHVADQARDAGSQLWPGPALAAVDFQGVNQRVDALSPVTVFRIFLRNELLAVGSHVCLGLCGWAEVGKPPWLLWPGAAAEGGRWGSLAPLYLHPTLPLHEQPGSPVFSTSRFLV